MSFERSALKLSAVVLSSALALAAMPAAAGNYVQAAGSSLTFATHYQGEVFTGRFPAFTTRLSFDPKQLAGAKLDVTIPLAGTTTANAERDETLLGAEFFSARSFPQARFVATRFRSLGGNQYAADGTMSLRGVDKPVTLTFTWTDGPRPMLTGKATVRRLDFNVGGGEWADTALIPNEVAVSTRVVFTPAP
ncbi:YceI family protein [Montanilutibacter psychrotolerans]|uniref:YceI family protein n=1 Tax=Montanilutibacter psychrotolerans TaxID=1327343 RepID=A0A3M8T5J4_9GAMM|nr:YceI family protein [Lysobacter psychrotolerans]RNF86012.1 YceI family protein [Lysobacter psychrotolerans]